MDKYETQIERQKKKVEKLHENYCHSREKYEKEKVRLDLLEKELEAQKYRRMMGNLHDRNIESEDQLLEALDSMLKK